MIKNIYEFTEYKTFINEYIGSAPYSGRGLKSKIAHHLNMHTAYVSQVLNKDAQFTVEQAYKLSSFFNLTKNESHYFILMVQYARAGTVDLEKYYIELMETHRKEQESLKNRLEVSDEVNEEDRQTYYSSWHYIAIHALLSTKKFNKMDEIAKRLSISIKKVQEVIEFLIRVGLIKKDSGEYKMGSKDLHLSKDSPMINMHHTNWRMQSIQSLSNDDKDDLHYSGVISVKKETAKEIHNILVNSLQEVRSEIKKSGPSEVYCYTVDLFKI